MYLDISVCATETAKAAFCGFNKYSLNFDSSQLFEPKPIPLFSSMSKSKTAGLNIFFDINVISLSRLSKKVIGIIRELGFDGFAITDALSKVSEQRSSLGAIQNRLEHTIANLNNVVENTTAAESRIRDTDMAEEMVEFSKNNILAQAGQSMLAQANQSTQGVLSLLQ